MNFKQLLAGAGLAIGLLASPALAQERVSIGTGGTGGLFYIIGAAWPKCSTSTWKTPPRALK